MFVFNAYSQNKNFNLDTIVNEESGLTCYQLKDLNCHYERNRCYKFENLYSTAITFDTEKGHVVITTIYYPSGEISSIGSTLNSKQDGVYEVFFKNGNPRIVGFFNALNYDEKTKDTLFIDTLRFPGNDIGQIITVVQYFTSPKSGYWKYYYENGYLQSEGNYKNNLRDGEWSFYRQTNGELILKRIYALGKVEKDILLIKSSSFYTYPPK